MARYALDPLGVAVLSGKQTFRRIPTWIRLSVWRFAFSLLILTIPAASAAFYYTVREGLRDPFNSRVNLRAAFLDGFRLHLKRGTLLGATNLVVFAVMVYSLIFWASQEAGALYLLAGVAACFLIFWWCCQPLLYPVLVEHPQASIRDVVRTVIGLALTHPIFAILLAMMTTALTLVGLLLLGPALVVLGPLVALISIQGYWAMAGLEIPDLIDPAVYTDKMDTELNGQG